MTIPVGQIIFFVFSALLVGAALMVILARNPLHSVLFLVMAFFASAVLWMQLQAEFLSLVLIFVYVGAVMTLFLFVVMMLDVNVSALKEGFIRHWMLVVLMMSLLMAAILYMIHHWDWSVLSPQQAHHAVGFSNTKQMGTALYTHYLYPFEIASLILLVAMVSAIALAFHGPRKDRRHQDIAQQVSTRKSDRLRLIDLKDKKQ